jgi:hypothetical protein
MTFDMRRSLDLALILAVAALANFTYLYCSDGDYFYPDSFTYLAPAKMLLSGHGFATKPGVPEVMRTPVYPLLLAAFGTRVLPVIVLQHLMNIGLAVAIYFFALRRGRFVAIAAALLFAIDPPSIHYANKLLTETLFTVLLFVAFWMGGQARVPVLHGVLVGVLVLTRPVAIAYFVVVAVVFALTRMRRRAVALFTAAALVLPMGWALRNKIEGGIFTVSVIGAANILLHRAAGAIAITDEGDFEKDLAEEQNDLLEQAHEQIQRERHVAAAEDLSEGVRAPYYSALARRVILQHPAGFALLTLRGLAVNVFDSDWDAMMIVSRLESRTIELVLGAFAAIVFALAVAGVLVLWRTDRPLALMLTGTVVYFLLISAGSEAEARFRVPVIPQLAIAAACGLDALRRTMSGFVVKPLEVPATPAPR